MPAMDRTLKKKCRDEDANVDVRYNLVGYKEYIYICIYKRKFRINADMRENKS